jgi:starvation-inducible DNA-binding protein
MILPPEYLLLRAGTCDPRHMSISDTHAHLPALGEHERKQAGHYLQSTLVELIDLSLIGKQLHWNIVCHCFRDFHLQLDELVDEWHGLADTVAERAVAIGHPADGRASAVAQGSELRPVEPGSIEVPAALHELVDRVAEVDERVRDRLDRLGEIDLVSQDVLIEVSRAVEKQLWMIRSQI